MAVRLPKHLKDNPKRLAELRKVANGFAGHYGQPVYLTGSALADFNDKPRDWDLRLMLPDEDFEVRYGSVDEWIMAGGSGAWTIVRWRWNEDCLKQTKWAWKMTAGLNIDFQVYPERWAKMRFPDAPKVRLDTAPRSPVKTKRAAPKGVKRGGSHGKKR